MDMEQACDMYLAHLQVERNLSRHTVEAYARDLAQLRSYLLEQHRVSDATQVVGSHLQEWLQGMAVAGARASTQARARSSMRQLFVFLRRQQVVRGNPCADVAAPRPTRTLPSVLLPGETRRLVEAASATTPRGLRDRAALELLYGSGLRVSEVCLLRVENLQLNEGLLRTLGKGSKERLVPVSEPARLALEAYLADGRPALLRGGRSDYVFIGNSVKPLSRMALFKVVRRYALQAGIVKPQSPHKLRHAFATDLLRGGADLRSVQQLLGHASISTTEIYTHVAQNELQEVVDAHHPLGRRRQTRRSKSRAPMPLPRDERGEDEL